MYVLNQNMIQDMYHFLDYHQLLLNIEFRYFEKGGMRHKTSKVNLKNKNK